MEDDSPIIAADVMSLKQAPQPRPAPLPVEDQHVASE
jgi:hypothetical protein